MRDDLHKGCTMGQHWSKVIRRAANNAAWKTDVGPAIESALLRDLRHALDHAGIAALFDPARPTLFSPGALLPTGTGNQLIDSLAAHISLREEEGLRADDLRKQALADAVREDLDAKKREMLAGVTKRHPGSVDELSRRFNAGAPNVVERAVAASLGERKPTATPKLDLDGDLLGGKS